MIHVPLTRSEDVCSCMKKLWIQKSNETVSVGLTRNNLYSVFVERVQSGVSDFFKSIRKTKCLKVKYLWTYFALVSFCVFC